MPVKKNKVSALKTKKKTPKKQPPKSKAGKGSKSTGVVSKRPNVFLDKFKKREKLNKENKKKNAEHNSDEENDETILDNVMDILDEDDLEYLNNTKSRKRKGDTGDDEDELISKSLEIEYKKQSVQEKSGKKLKIDLLPIKSREGQIITRTAKVDYKQKQLEENSDDDVVLEEEEEEEDENVYDSDDDIVNDINERNDDLPKKVISTTDLLIRRQQEIERQKYRIGIICSGILEKPDEKIKNITALFELMDEFNEKGEPNLLSVRKIAMLSITEIFKDVLPEYRVGQVDTKMMTVRKATLERVTSENVLLKNFKKFLQKLEYITACISKRGGGPRTTQRIKMAETAVICLCDILNSHPYFNYVQNIAQLLVYMLNSNYSNMRECVFNCFQNVFKTDKRLDMTLYIVRRINHLIKTKSNNVHLETISCLLALKIKNVNLDAEKENELKQKKLEAHRQRLLSLSRKEKKRQKRLTELNRDLQETKAEENKQTKHFKLTEIIKIVFTIYFRILKNDPNTRLLSACLEGLSEFAHVINLEFFSDLIEVLNNLLETGDLGYREQLHCIQTIFVILSGQGEVLNIDPIRFYGHLYRNIIIVNAGKNHQDFLIVLRTLNDVLIKRRRNVTQQRLFAFVKRILTLSLQLLHHGTLASLGVVKTVMQLTSVLDIILDTDTSVGSGRFDPEIEDPEYCNASCTALYELTRLVRSYHPTVRKMALNIANGVPASGDGSLPSEIGKLTPEELFEQFDSTQMAFNPAIAVPRKIEPKVKNGRHVYFNSELKKYCRDVLKKKYYSNSLIDFNSNLKM